MNTPFKTAFFHAILILFGVVALISSSVAPALAERDEPGLPIDMQSHCNSLNLEFVFNPADLPDPSGRSWRCGKITEATYTSSINTACTGGFSIDVIVKKISGGGISVECTREGGTTVTYTVTDLQSIDIDKICAWQYQEYDAVNDTWVSFYEADSHDWSDPYALGCYSTLPEF